MLWGGGECNGLGVSVVGWELVLWGGGECSGVGMSAVGWE